MRIVHIVAGAGGMYCGSCLQSNTLATALQRAGHDLLVVPIYTPLRTDEPSAAGQRIAYGGLNVYLQQASGLFRFTPWFLDRWLDHPRLLNWISRFGSSVRPDRLGALTVSMMQGEAGQQRKELRKLIQWLKQDVQPEVVHLSNVMLVGMARELMRELNVPVICTLSGEDIFLEELTEPHYTQARDLLRERAGELPALVAMNQYFADFMAEYLSIPSDRIHIIRPGLNLEGHAVSGTCGDRESAPQAPTIGYFARICKEKGLHQLVDAFLELADDPELPDVRLRAAGYLADEDRGYLEELIGRTRSAGVGERFEYAGELDRDGKVRFLQSLDVMSVPTVYRESKGLSILEAWANRVPVVLPSHGAFPEMVADTGGGVLVPPGDKAALANSLKRLLLDDDLRQSLGQQAGQVVLERYDASVASRRLLELYEQTVNNHSGNS